ncbi:methyl-accepting chemotaxis protein [Halomonas shantousis]
MTSTIVFLKNMSLRARLMAGFSTVMVLMIVLTLISILQVNAIDRSLATVNDINSVKQRHAIDYRGSVHDRAIALRDVTLVTDDARLEALIGEIERLAANYRSADEQMQQLFTRQSDASTEERRILTDIESIRQRAQPLIQAVIERRQAGNTEDARQLLLDEAGPAMRQWLIDINRFIDLEEAMNERETSTARAMTGGFEILMMVLCGMAVVIGLLVATLLTRWLLRELGAEPGEVRVFAEKIGRGELSARARLRQGDRQSIMSALVAMAHQLQSTVSHVRASAEAVASNSEQIAEGNNELASRTEQQASALAETASSMEQLGSTVQQNADNARQASEEATNASRVAIRGGAVVGQVVETMNDLNQRSTEIAEIIAMIDEIAFQTNILALNASVEAARAGEHGRGFSVVASEVRQLAQRSAEAARQINTLISGNLERVEQGARLVAEAGQTTDEIVMTIQRVTQIMGEISQASAEQSEGVRQVGDAVIQMDRVTQQNSALVEDSAMAANNLRRNAEQLMQAMGAFQLNATAQGLDGSDPAASTAPASRPAPAERLQLA